jgi:hypothetical protein
MCSFITRSQLSKKHVHERKIDLRESGIEAFPSLSINRIPADREAVPAKEAELMKVAIGAVRQKKLRELDSV